MRKILIFCSAVILFSCGNDKKQIENLTSQITKLEAQNKNLKDSLDRLKFPADQRLAEINRLMQANEFAKAKKEIQDLKGFFPKSSEAAACEDILKTIATKEQEAKAEAERIKALGFKALPQNTSFSVGENNVSISAISVGTQFVFDDYGHQYFFRTADRGNKYVTAAMSITSENKDPKLPAFAVYKVQGAEMNKVEGFVIRFARWDDYGSYLGNYHDNGNDFSKVSTVRFKIGAEVAESVTSGAFAIVADKKNSYTREYDRFANPPVSYEGTNTMPSKLKVEDFNSGYKLVKLFNLN